jgi:branched-chain amino acid transport system ATP-binding protein
MQNNPILKVDHLTVSYGHIRAVKDVSFTVNTGEITALVGANGAGKSTTLLAISKIIPAMSGEVSFARGPNDWVNLLTQTSAQIVRLGVSQVAEGRAILLTLSVEENLLLGAYTRLRNEDLTSDLQFVFELFPILKSRLKELAGNLSGGEQQMLAIGRALMAKPKLLLLDEPSMGLAPLKVQEIFQVLKELNRLGQSIVLVEQNVQQALRIAHQAYVLENGQISLQGVGKELLSDPRIVKAYLGA